MEKFRKRQVHLDFHTSPMIPGVGEKFNKEEWQNALKIGHVNSITVFSKCHHGYSYHPTEVNEMHPSLKFDLLGAELEACKEIGVRAPVYISAGLDEKDAVTHHEWLLRGEDNFDEEPDFSRPGYHQLCLNTEYLDKLLKEIDEVMLKYNPCEIFLDIVGERVCYCKKCRSDMEKAGIDWHIRKNVEEFGRKIYRRYLDEVYKLVKSRNPETTIFQNSGHVTKGRTDLIDTIEQLELESLPTGGWGYDHFPLSAAYVRTLGKDFLGMTGKFHKTWGEFGGFKHPNALRYETSLSLACGGGCSIGDQMHPCGKLNESTFGLIGKAYAEIEQKEPWCEGTEFIADIAVLSTESISGSRNSVIDKADIGANRILFETNRLYNFIDRDSSLDGYKLLILPDFWTVDEKLKKKIDIFLSKGGKLLLSGKSGLNDKDEFVFDTGAVFKGQNNYSPNYLVPKFNMTNGITEYLMRPVSFLIDNIDAEAVAAAQDPYFNRTAEHFCSHQHAPNNFEYDYPGCIIKGNIAYIGWNIFSGYAEFGDLHLKETVNHIICALMGNEFSVKADMPDKGIVTLFNQGSKKILHLLYAHTTIRGKDTEVIEDIVPLYDIKASVKSDAPSKVRLVPECTEIPFEYKNGFTNFTVPKVYIHQMIEIS